MGAKYKDKGISRLVLSLDELSSASLIAERLQIKEEMFPRSPAEYAKIRWILDVDYGHSQNYYLKPDEPMMCNVCRNRVTEYRRIADVFICNNCSRGNDLSSS